MTRIPYLAILRQFDVFMFFIFLPTLCAGQHFGTPGEQVAVRLGSGGTVYGYYVYLPDNYVASDPAGFPLVLFFHGFDENGNGENELSNVLRHGPPQRLKNGYDLPAIVISPQNAQGAWKIEEIHRFLGDLADTYSVDPRSIFLTGLSKGGGAVWEYAARYPGTVRAAIPIAGSFDYQEVTDLSADSLALLRQKPVWAFHSLNDPVVPSANSFNNADVLTATEASVYALYPGTYDQPADTVITMLYDEGNQTWEIHEGIVPPQERLLAVTIYPDLSHDSWTVTYDDDLVIEWLLSRSESHLRVHAGRDSAFIQRPDTLLLNARILDDGGAQITTSLWSQLSGPQAILLNEQSSEAMVVNPETGSYSFEFYARNGKDEEARDTLRIELIDTITSQDDPDDDPILVLWPNPADGTLKGRFDGDLPFTIRLYTQGRQLMDLGTFREREFDLQLEVLPSGLYLILLESSGKRFTKRIILK